MKTVAKNNSIPSIPVDSLGRRFRKLRVSLTEQCNNSCLYCDPDYRPSRGNETTSAEQMAERILRVYNSAQLHQVHLTGGEPLLYAPLLELIGLLKKSGVDTVTLTTNGRLLNRMSKKLVHAGLDSANVSLDAVELESYRAIAGRGNPDEVMRGVDHALGVGLRLKMNATILYGINHDQVVPLMMFARSRKIKIRYIELMSMGIAEEDFRKLYYPQNDILKQISESFGGITEHERTGRAARYYETDDGYRFGIIANTSDPFCSSCDRLRMDSRGRMYGCLTDATGIVTDYMSEPKLLEDLAELLARKSPDRFGGAPISMRTIGG